MIVNPNLESASRNVLFRNNFDDRQIENYRHLEDYNKEKQSVRGDVVQKPMDIDNVMGMYVVALVAGVSAAITVGLISLGIAWYT